MAQDGALLVSAIIVNYNVREFLANAVSSLKKALAGIPSEIIVVDNASDDGSVAMLRRDFPDVVTIASAENLGFARANNLGMRRSGGKFILLINPDTVTQEDTLRIMLDYFTAHPATGLAGCKILNPDGSFQLSCRRSFPSPWVSLTKISGLSSLFPRTRLFGRYNLTYLDPDRSYDIDALSGSFMMFRREVFEQIGGLDEDYFMYGEDLDFCYRVQKSGWKISYVPATSIIHYKGESTRRSNIDEIRTFYEAMRLFVDKHLGRSILLLFVLRSAITITAWLAAVKRLLLPLRSAPFDFLCANLSLAAAELLHLGNFEHIPSYARPLYFTVPAFTVVAVLYALGVYTYRRMSLIRSLSAAFISIFIIAAEVAFFKQFAFSRMIILISGCFNMLLLPGWRILYQMVFRNRANAQHTLFSRRTLIVGTGGDSVELARRLGTRADGMYRVVGYVDTAFTNVGTTLDGIPVLGHLDVIGKLIKEEKINDIIFPAQTLSYTEILSVIAHSRQVDVNFHIVPTSLEVIIGKSNVDTIDGVPLIEISYNIERPSNRFNKRILDLVFSFLLYTAVGPFVALKRVLTGRTSSVFIRQLPDVIAGRKSLVGYPEELATTAAREETDAELLMGKPGLTGLLQLRDWRNLSAKDIEHFNIYYAKNQSLGLDLEILLRTLFRQKPS